MSEKIGVIDIGSNTIRLVIYELSQTGKVFKVIENIKVAARLRSYIDHKGLLGKDAIAILVQTLLDFKEIVNHYQLPNVTCVATAAIRQAGNRQEVIQLIEEKTTFKISLLSEYEEAHFGFLAVIHSTSITEGITIDMGGASTEITYFRDRKLVHYHSFPFGSLSLKLQFVSGDIPTTEEKELIHQFLLEQFQQHPWISNRNIPVIAMGGSARSIVKVHQNMIQYPITGLHQYKMNIADVKDIKEKLYALTYTELQKVEGLSKERSSTILPASEFFEILCDISKATAFVLSSRGLREGILYQQIDTKNPVDLLSEASITELMYEFRINKYQADELIKIAKLLYTQVLQHIDKADLFDEADLSILLNGARLYHLGKYEEEEASITTFYLLSNLNILGLSHFDRVKLALLTSYKGKGTYQKYLQPFKKWYSKEEQFKQTILGAILKVSASLLSANHSNIQNIMIEPSGKTWSIHFECTDFFKIEEYHFNKQKRHLEKLLKVSILPFFQKEEIK
nr:Ppx/GppA family phosphatase [Fredinandcohnia onubensis]